MKRFIIIWFSVLLIFLFQPLNAQVLKRYVSSSGAATMTNGEGGSRATVGQSFIGRLTESETKHNVGFWYTARRIIDKGGPGAVVVIPKLSAEIGTTVEIPLILMDSKYLMYGGIRNFEATIRYNTTVLQPTGNMPRAVYTGNDESTVTITGTIDDSTGIMAQMTFLVRLGNVLSTPLIIDSVRWLEHDRVRLVKSDGELDILGICEEGDTSRLISRGNKTGIFSIRPNPVNTFFELDYILSEKGQTEISLISNNGKEVWKLVQGDAEPGWYTLPMDVKDIQSGTYNVILLTPSELYIRKLIINK